MSTYTDAIVAEMREIGTFNRETAREFAGKHGLSLKSVVGKITFEPDLVYVKSEVAATPKRRRKADVTRSIEGMLRLEKDTLYELTRGSAAALLTLEAELSAIVDDPAEVDVDSDSEIDDAINVAAAESGDLDDVPNVG